MDWELVARRFDFLLEQSVNGLTIGGIYGLIAVGYTMVYGVIGLINFAHGEVFMLGAFVCVGAIALGMPLPIAIAVAILACAAIGVGMERLAYRPLRRAPRLAALITAIGMSIFFQNLAIVIWGAERRGFADGTTMDALDEPAIEDVGFGDLTFDVSWYEVTIVAVAAALMLGLHLLIHRTRLGMAMRAVAQDRVAASLMGISVDRVVAATFLVGSALAAVAGILVGAYYDDLHPYMGYHYGIKAFAAAVLGGIGNIRGAMLGGLVLGMAEAFGSAYLSSAYRDGIAYAILIAVIVFKPSGLLGRPQEDRA